VLLRQLDEAALLRMRIALAFERVARGEDGIRLRIQQDGADSIVCGLGRGFAGEVERILHVPGMVVGAGRRRMCSSSVHDVMLCGGDPLGRPAICDLGCGRMGGGIIIVASAS